MHVVKHMVDIIDTLVILLKVTIFDLKDVELCLRFGLLFTQSLLYVIH